MKSFHLPLLILLLAGMLILTFRLFQLESKHRLLKEDFIELSMARYGIFNVDEWKRIISEIISRKIDEFNLEEDNREVMRAKIRAFLYHVLDDSENNYNDQRSGSLLGLFQKSVASVTDIFGHLKNEVPKITEDILTFMDDPENREQIKIYIQTQLDKYADETFAAVDYSKRNEILQRYETRTRGEGIAAIHVRVDELEDQSEIFQWLIAIITVGLLMYFLVKNSIGRNEIVVGLMASFVLLLSGVLLPMIDIDARVSSFNFYILGEPVSFENQVLYFKSKSILEVVSLMMTQGKLNIFLVGVLVLSFSVLFPVTKLIASEVFLFKPSFRSQKWVRFFVFRS